ncbi:hypothetical protein ACFL54_07725, partial [Planctomycetota bacterium]
MKKEAFSVDMSILEGVLQPGQESTIEFALNVSEPTRARGVHVSFHGYEWTKAIYTTSDGKTTTTHTAIEKVTIVKDQVVAMGEEAKGFMYNVVDGIKTIFGGGDAEEIAPGNYQIELPVRLPENARSSFEGDYVKVKYEAKLQV